MMPTMRAYSITFTIICFTTCADYIAFFHYFFITFKTTKAIFFICVDRISIHKPATTNGYTFSAINADFAYVTNFHDIALLS
jgi:hypothetical protein